MLIISSLIYSILFVLNRFKFFAKNDNWELSRKLATKPEYVTPPHSSYEELEDLFWKDLLNDKALPPIYGADVCDSITDKVSSS